jgi:hypothetical protein
MERSRWREEGRIGWFATAAPDLLSGPMCCAPEWIATHYTAPEDMAALYAMETAECEPPLEQWPFLKFS